MSLANMPRRTFLVASSLGLSGFAFGRAVPQARAAKPAAGFAGSGGKAKSTILFFLSGGASHVDMWDMKPEAPLEYRGPFQPIATSSSDVRLCEHLPLLAKQAHHLAVINSVGATVNTNDHHAGYYHNLTGHVPDQTFPPAQPAFQATTAETSAPSAAVVPVATTAAPQAFP
ncbi:MAG: DUF1501 domain-containing protein, partial [Aureliella sp.]